MAATRTLATAALLALMLSAAHVAPAAAQEDKPYLAAKLQLGIAGNVATDAGVAGLSSGSVDQDAEVSYGGVFGYMHPLHHFFVLGAELGVQSWQTESGSDLDLDRNILADLSIVPQGRLPVGGIVELYVSLPIGIALDFFNGFDSLDVGGGAVSADVDPAVGLAFSALVGARITLLGGFGFIAEAGYSLHSFSHSIDAEAANVALGDVDVDVKVEQFVVRAGVYF
jgi:opacity protein-like surface antigen